MNRMTPNQRLAGIILGQPVGDWIAERRATGRSWRLISRDLYEATHGQLDLTHETIRGWAEAKAA